MLQGAVCTVLVSSLCTPATHSEGNKMRGKDANTSVHGDIVKAVAQSEMWLYTLTQHKVRPSQRTPHSPSIKYV